MDRREFLKTFGIGAVTTTATLYGCNSKTQQKAETTTPELGPVPTDKMTYRSFPALGDDKVSILGYGCMRWPMKPAPEGQKGEVIDQEAVNRLVDYAMAHGVNYYDMAPVYLQGQCERATAEALRRYPRKSYYLATKLSNFSDFSREGSMRMYHNSFKNMQVEYIDYYMLHSLGRGGLKNFNERFVDNGMMDFLLEERKAGRIRHLGWSFHGSKEAFDEILGLHEKYHWDFVMIQMNYIDWYIANRNGLNAEYLYNELAKRGIPVAIMEPLLGGRLAKLPDHILTRLKQRRPESSAASWAFRFAGTPEYVMTVNSGMTYMEHLQDNIRSFAPLVPLTDQERAFLGETAALINDYPTIPCTSCQYCMPCPYGIDIPSILQHYNKCVNEGNVPESKQDPNYRKARRAFLVGYDRAVEKLRQADHCIGCRKCVEECPQHIDIPRQLRRIDKVVDRLKQDL